MSVPRIVPVSDLRQDTAGLIKEATTKDEPVFITQRGRPSAVLLSAKAYERTQRELEILRLLTRGEAEIEAGVGHELGDVLAEGRRLLTEE